MNMWSSEDRVLQLWRWIYNGANHLRQGYGGQRAQWRNGTTAQWLIGKVLVTEGGVRVVKVVCEVFYAVYHLIVSFASFLKFLIRWKVNQFAS